MDKVEIVVVIAGRRDFLLCKLPVWRVKYSDSLRENWRRERPETGSRLFGFGHEKDNDGDCDLVSWTWSL